MKLPRAVGDEHKEEHLFPGLVMIPFKHLSHEDQIKFAASSGKGMKPDTMMLIYQLENDRLYTLSDMAAMFYRKGTGPHHNMTKRLHSFLAYREVQPDEAGEHGACWYGATVKDCLEGRFYYLAETRCELLRVLKRISQLSPEDQNVAVAEPQKALIDEPEPEIKKSKRVAPFVIWLATAALLIAGFTSIYLASRPLDVGSDQRVIAVLPCVQTRVGAIMQEMVSRGLNDTSSFNSLPANRIEALTGNLSVCQEPSNTVIQKMFDDLDSGFLLWGRTEENRTEYVWTGSLLARNGQNRIIKVKASNFRALADEVVQRCLKAVGSDEIPGAAIDLYSANTNASFLYSEAIIHFQNGDIRAALGNFQRAGSVFDPEFYLARNMWARCMEINGDLVGARTVLESIVEKGKTGAVPDQVLVQAYKYLAFVYNDNHEMANLKELLDQVEQMDMPEDDRLYFEFRKAWFLSKYDPEEALALAERTLEASKKPVIQIDALWNAAAILCESDRLRAGEMLDQAEALAITHKAPGRLLDILCEKARLLVRYGTQEEVLAHIGVLEKAKALPLETGSAWDRLKTRYWLGVCYGKVGDEDKELTCLYDVALESQQLGIVEFEVKSRVFLVRRMLEMDNLFEARRLLKPIESKRLAPKYRILALNIGVHLHLKAKEYEAALIMLSELENLGREVDDVSALAKVFNDRGWALYNLGRYEEAEKLYGDSLILREEHHLNQEVTLKNLILLHRELGNEQNVKRYERQLSELQ